jgi:hypothetical protein
MIHCDEVFDILTRGPFPTGAASDGIVESHLKRCGECRRLAEALRPAIELFQEAVTPEESHGLPSYWGGSCDRADPWSAGDGDSRVEPLHRPRRLAAKRRASRAAQTRPIAATYGTAGRPWPPAARWAAAVLLGIALASWLAHAGTSPHAALSKPELTKARWQLDETPGDWLKRHDPPEVCYLSETQVHTIVAGPPGHDRSVVRLACCKGCHGERGHDAEARLSANELLATCVACHQF